MEEKDKKRFYYIRENHFGFGIRWRSGDYELDISISIPFISFVFGFGEPI